MNHSSAPSIFLQTKLFLSLMRRKAFPPVCRGSANWRIKVILASAILLVFLWMQLGTLKPVAADLPKAVSEIPMKGKAKEYPDFDYKYDLRKEKKTFGADESDTKKEKDTKVERLQAQLQMQFNKTNKLHPQKSVERNGRRRASLNGVELSSNHAEFDVVGGLDLFQAQKNRPSPYNEFSADDAKVVAGLGELGEPVHLNEEEEALSVDVMKKEAFNLVASDKISLHRAVPDTRDPLCMDQTYNQSLPTTSVIIIYTNEAWTPLLRTIWSVLDKTPAAYLKEIILVDDASDKKHLGGKLSRYIQQKFPSKVRLKRLAKRSGLIRARLTGARLATGDVLLFLDSHCECGTDWIQPLLQRIQEDRRVFAIPIIDVIDDKTLEYYHGNGVYFQIGGFTWAGHFNWIDIPEHENERRGSSIGPTRTPTMAGGLFAVDREFFWEIGSYDEEMEVWGGENLEMSFRVWQCGGILENIPCSRVGHIFRSFHPYSFPGNKDTHGINTARTVEVWMDDYKRLFYMNRPDLLSTEIGDVGKRQVFKEERSCKSFKWYLNNIFPQKFILDDPEHVFAYGRVRNPSSNNCLDTLQNEDKDNYELGLYPCHSYVAASQFFSFSQSYELRREDQCAEVSLFSETTSTEQVRMVPCHSLGEDQEWMHTKEGRLIHKATNKCLEAQMESQIGLIVAPCKAKASQVWYFDSYVK